MKSAKNLLLSIFMLLPLFLAVPVFAQTDEQAPEQSTTETNSANPENKPPTTLEERIKQRKDAMKVRLSNAEKVRVQNRCKVAQGGLRSLEGRIKGIETSRSQVYANLIDRLEKLSAKLKEKGLDTTTLDEQIATLKTKIEAFNADLTVYKQAIADLGAMDCESDPEAFKASLEAARELRQKLKANIVDIRTYVNETIKPTLAQLRSQLPDKPEDN